MRLSPWEIGIMSTIRSWLGIEDWGWGVWDVYVCVGGVHCDDRESVPDVTHGPCRVAELV